MFFKKYFSLSYIILIGFFSSIFFFLFGLSLLSSSIRLIVYGKHYEPITVKASGYRVSSIKGSPIYSVYFDHNGKTRKVVMNNDRHKDPRRADSIEGIWYNPRTERYLHRNIENIDFSLKPHIPQFIATLILAVPFFFSIIGLVYWIWKLKLRLTYRNGLMKFESFADKQK